jgi:3,4-dihydroxy 2-butanone 4-phosphate synthase/GTP cyclohydrolase II
MTTARIPTDDGEFNLSLYRNNRDDKEHLAIIYGDVTGHADVLVRVHSECFTGDVLGSRRCDCGSQLARARQIIATEGSGVIVYMRQEGRGIGLMDKLRAYNLQDEGYDTVEANVMLGHQPDERDYAITALILQDLGISRIRLLTNNPAKIDALTGLGITVTQRVPLETPITVDNASYLRTKANRMAHLLSIDGLHDLDSAANGNGHAQTSHD